MKQPKIYVGNLAYGVTSNDLRDFFAKYGEIAEVKVITDHETGRSKGFAFVTFASADDAEKSLAANGFNLQGRNIKVNIARDNVRQGGGGAGGGGGGGGSRRESYR